ncbi:peptidoglycan editing factor PgeF [Acuticoccus sp. MNP-M23]|uniref:peptidoglycan editing factor PgeF n=1 Tax=Acuticoccus sp. MNP-M23 TaxID=3072793 RepID=UPI0028149EE0|nr:peptidoglycan editing factor PgeF [Acuticoccus sp. MNP-M23]WMS43879.1 peptidoglycan editing factor PgeF [Acuticoccus sp. MNP-M23]
MPDVVDAPPFLTAPALSSAGIRHGFFTRQGGVSSGIYASLNAGRGSADRPDDVAENRARIAGAMGVPATALVSMNQIHSADVLTLDAPPDGRPKVDGLVTTRPGIALGVLHADCAPVLFADAGNRVIGGAHAGWRGATGGILEATVDEMVAQGARRSAIVAVVGPTIGAPSYEVGPDFPAPVIDANPEAARCFAPSARPGHHMFDLPGYIVMRLSAAGVGTVENLGLDTYADPDRFFSYRRTTHRGEADYGRMLAAIALEA